MTSRRDQLAARLPADHPLRAKILGASPADSATAIRDPWADVEWEDVSHVMRARVPETIPDLVDNGGYQCVRCGRWCGMGEWEADMQRGAVCAGRFWRQCYRKAKEDRQGGTRDG